MTDNALVYTRSARFTQILQQIGAKHITIPPYTPRWNGKAERVIRTLQDEWAYAHTWNNSQQRTRALQIIRPLLQPKAATQQPRRPATHQPRSQPP